MFLDVTCVPPSQEYPLKGPSGLAQMLKCWAEGWAEQNLVVTGQVWTNMDVNCNMSGWQKQTTTKCEAVSKQMSLWTKERGSFCIMQKACRFGGSSHYCLNSQRWLPTMHSGIIDVTSPRLSENKTWGAVRELDGGKNHIDGKKGCHLHLAYLSFAQRQVIKFTLGLSKGPSDAVSAPKAVWQ